MIARHPPNRFIAIGPLAVCVVATAYIAGLSVDMSSNPTIQNSLVRRLPSMVRFVPSVARIASETRNNDPMTQWLFVPIYALIWFYTGPPWSRSMREGILKVSRGLSNAKRFVLLPFGIAVLCAWELGNIGVIHFPTMYNGGYVYPRADAIVQLQSIYQSQRALAFYAWLGPILEVGGALVSIVNSIQREGIFFAGPAVMSRGGRWRPAGVESTRSWYRRSRPLPAGHQ